MWKPSRPPSAADRVTSTACTELDEAAASVSPAELVAFLDRLDGWTAALEAYASPELVLDGALLSWPRARATAA